MVGDLTFANRGKHAQNLLARLLRSVAPVEHKGTDDVQGPQDHGIDLLGPLVNLFLNYLEGPLWVKLQGLEDLMHLALKNVAVLGCLHDSLSL